MYTVYTKSKTRRRPMTRSEYEYAHEYNNYTNDNDRDQIMNTKESAEEQYRELHYLIKCPYCGNELVIAHSELHKELFEPKEVEMESYEFVHDDKTHKITSMKKNIRKEMCSSDPSKDIYKGIKCCYCGCVWDENVADMYDKRCNPDGRKTRIFELTENETKAAAEFRKEHSHKEELEADGKLAFSTLGMQFTYEITPGGLGNGIVIKCNYCGETKDITDIDNW